MAEQWRAAHRSSRQKLGVLEAAAAAATAAVAAAAVAAAAAAAAAVVPLPLERQWPLPGARPHADALPPGKPSSPPSPSSSLLT